MSFLKVVSLAEAYKVLEACRAALSEGFYVIDLQTKTHIAGRDLTDTIALLDSGAQWCRD